MRQRANHKRAVADKLFGDASLEDRHHVGCSQNASRRLGRDELGGLERVLQAVQSRPDRQCKLLCPWGREHAFGAADEQFVFQHVAKPSQGVTHRGLA
jgi:hypothetical protein